MTRIPLGRTAARRRRGRTCDSVPTERVPAGRRRAPQPHGRKSAVHRRDRSAPRRRGPAREHGHRGHRADRRTRCGRPPARHHCLMPRDRRSAWRRCSGASSIPRRSSASPATRAVEGVDVAIGARLVTAAPGAPGVLRLLARARARRALRGDPVATAAGAAPAGAPKRSNVVTPPISGGTSPSSPTTSTRRRRTSELVVCDAGCRAGGVPARLRGGGAALRAGADAGRARAKMPTMPSSAICCSVSATLARGR